MRGEISRIFRSNIKQRMCPASSNKFRFSLAKTSIEMSSWYYRWERVSCRGGTTIPIIEVMRMWPSSFGTRFRFLLVRSAFCRLIFSLPEFLLAFLVSFWSLFSGFYLVVCLFGFLCVTFCVSFTLLLRHVHFVSLFVFWFSFEEEADSQGTAYFFLCWTVDHVGLLCSGSYFVLLIFLNREVLLNG